MKSFRFIVYAKGLRGRSIFESLVEHKLIPELIILEKSEIEFEKRLENLGVQYKTCDNPKSQDHKALIEKLLPDLIVCAGYSKILPKEVVFAPRLGTINCHGGRLPQYRGASPIPWQIINGEISGEAYVLEMTQNIDDGRILASEEYEILRSETARHVTLKVVEIFSRLVPEVVQKTIQMNSLPIGTPQNSKDVCHWGRRYPDDGKIDWSLRGDEIINLIRALDFPYPGAFIEIDMTNNVVVESARLISDIRGVPGRVLGKTDHSILIACKDGAIEILKVKKEGELINANLLELPYGTLLL